MNNVSNCLLRIHSQPQVLGKGYCCYMCPTTHIAPTTQDILSVRQIEHVHTCKELTPLPSSLNKDKLRKRRPTNPRHLIIIDNFKVLICVTHKIDVLRREHLQRKDKGEKNKWTRKF